MFYAPNIPYAFVHGLAARNLVFYTAVNPGIKNSGIGSESKYETLNLLPKEYVPKSVLHKPETDIQTTISKISDQKISFPVIAKPDVGYRGLMVKKIATKEELTEYLTKYSVSFIIQEFLAHKYECGIFYYRHPNHEKGQVTSITLKEFLTVNGDGISTLEHLVKKDSRAFLYYNLLKEDSNINWTQIPEKDQPFKLSSIGNHSKGTRFINGNHLINDKIERAMDTLNHQVKGWYYGRLDVKYHSLEELFEGKFKVLELNGILAEPTHIYDSTQMNYWQALKTIRTHWKQLYKIARYNHRHNHVPYRKTIPFVKEMVRLKSYTNKLVKLSNN